MRLPKNSPLWPKLIAHRRVTERRRAEAFCDGPDWILGLPCEPLTPATFSLLVAHGSPFAVGGIPREGDVRNYFWFHSRIYADKGTSDWPDRKRRALAPLELMLAGKSLSWFGWRLDIEHYAATLAIAIAEIRGITEEAFADAPKASVESDGESPSASLQAEMIAVFSRPEFGWAPERTSRTPLRQLFQIIRASRAVHGNEMRDAAEDKILADHIAMRNAELTKASEPREEPAHG